MKKILITISAFALISCTTALSEKTEEESQETPVKTQAYIEEQGRDTIFDFENSELNKLPIDWSQFYTGKKGENPNWQIKADNTNKVLAQLTKANPNYHFNVVVFNKIVAKNIELAVDMKAVSGGMDQGGGFVWRFTDAGNYYVVRANPLENNVVLYKVKNGVRTDLPLMGKGRTYGVDVPEMGKTYHKLKLIVKDNIFTVFLDGKELFKVKDDTFENAGKIGLWTKADAVTYFDNFSVKIIN